MTRDRDRSTAGAALAMCRPSLTPAACNPLREAAGERGAAAACATRCWSLDDAGRRLAGALATALLAVLVSSGVAAAAAPPADPWALLAQARERMQQGGPQLWDFAQAYLPTGFDRGEEESGRVALDLPRCVRWDYDDPYPKSFLLCGEKLWTWNPGEPAGHVYDLDQAQPGLDLLLLSVADLSQRYTATAQPTGGSMRVLLVPKRGQGGDQGPGAAGADAGARAPASNALRDAAILIDKEGLVRELTYRDADGNRTTFRFANRRALEDGGVFTPPASLKWQREGDAEPG